MVRAVCYIENSPEAVLIHKTLHLGEVARFREPEVRKVSGYPVPSRFAEGNHLRLVDPSDTGRIEEHGPPSLKA